MRKILVTGGAGFIGSSFVEACVARGDKVVVLDALTYAGRRLNLQPWAQQIEFVKADICDEAEVQRLVFSSRFDAIVNFAAESHVDRSIESAGDFIKTNVMGVYSLLNAARLDWEKRGSSSKFRFIQVSTDEVFGTLGDTGAFSEETPYAPNSPYSASKAGGDQLARAWFHTYKLPVIVTNCSNNYGPRQFPEKLIPHMIQCALTNRPLPVYGAGQNVRDWIHVHDHCSGVLLALEKGKPGEKYCFGGRSERKNLDVVRSICSLLDRLKPKDSGSYADQIEFVTDRKGHDWRYAIDDARAEKELGFTRVYSDFESGLEQTVKWYLDNQMWVQSVLTEGQDL